MMKKVMTKKECVERVEALVERYFMGDEDAPMKIEVDFSFEDEGNEPGRVIAFASVVLQDGEVALEASARSRDEGVESAIARALRKLAFYFESK